MAQQKLKTKSFDVNEFMKRSLKSTYGNGGSGTAHRTQKRAPIESNERARLLGLGSTLSRTEAGRKKHVTALLGGDKSAIQSYKRGRAEGLANKKEYLMQQRAARRTVRQTGKGKGKK